MSKDNKNSNRGKKVFKEAVQGRTFFSFDFFKRNIVYIAAITIMMLMYISNKYVCQNSMKEVMDLKAQLENAKTDCVNTSARYNSLIRESRMKQYVDSMHIDISAPDQPPYHLSNAD